MIEKVFEREFCLFILNLPIDFPLLDQLLEKAKIIYCADGGANRLYDLHKTILPNYIIGDLDSIRPDVHDHYNAQNVPIQKIACQDTTDLQKCLNHLKELNKTISVVILGGIGGRLDQTLQCLNTLLLYSTREIFMLNSDQWLRLYMPGQYTIPRPKLGYFDKASLALVPLIESVVTTKGLEWDLKEGVMQFGGLVSTSNRYKDQVLEMTVHKGAIVFILEWNLKQQ